MCEYIWARIGKIILILFRNSLVRVTFSILIIKRITSEIFLVHITKPCDKMDVQYI